MKKPTITVFVKSESVDAIRSAVTSAWNEYLQAGAPTPKDQSAYDMFLEAVETPMLAATLQYTRGNQTRTALTLGMHRNTLRSKIKDYGLGLTKTRGEVHPSLEELLQIKADYDWLVENHARVADHPLGYSVVLVVNNQVVRAPGRPTVSEAIAAARELVETARSVA